MKAKLVLSRTLWDPCNTWSEIKIVEVEIPLEKQDPDGKGFYNVVGCCWPEEDGSC